MVVQGESNFGWMGIERVLEGVVQAELMVEAEVEGDVSGGGEFWLIRILDTVVGGVDA